MTIDVTRDREGTTQALVELLEDEFAFSRVRRAWERAGSDDERDHALASLPPRTLSPGYYRWGSYLFWLEARIAAGVAFALIDGREMDGLVAVKCARNKWESDHPACPCGARQESRFAQRCGSCGLEFRQGAA